MRIAARLQKLERENAGARGKRCGECGRLIGWRCGDRPDPAVKYVASFANEGGPSDRPEVCPGCGTRRVYWATFK